MRRKGEKRKEYWTEQKKNRGREKERERERNGERE